MKTDDITQRVIGCAYTVGNTLGAEFLEKVYENALVHELRKAGLNCAQQHKIQVWYDGVVVGDFVADVLVENMVLLGLCGSLMKSTWHSVSHLKASGLKVCLLINFGTPKVGIKRVVYQY
jgi:GxxExxY protein